MPWSWVQMWALSQQIRTLAATVAKMSLLYVLSLCLLVGAMPVCIFMYQFSSSDDYLFSFQSFFMFSCCRWPCEKNMYLPGNSEAGPDLLLQVCGTEVYPVHLFVWRVAALRGRRRRGKLRREWYVYLTNCIYLLSLARFPVSMSTFHQDSLELMDVLCSNHLRLQPIPRSYQHVCLESRISAYHLSIQCFLFSVHDNLFSISSRH